MNLSTSPVAPYSVSPSDVSPTPDYQSEVRFAVVMYGGVSLAIYINGVAQELLRLVRATATSEGGSRPLIQDSELEPSERVYRKLSYLLSGEEYAKTEERLKEGAPIMTRFIIDVIAGTSAGGINGIFLAKALANGQDIAKLKELWEKEGDIGKLINDKWSVEKPLSLQRPPASLLNSQRIYRKLLDAFEGMEKVNARGAYVDELDLFVTTTDIQGVALPIRLADAVVYERRHRNVFHFIYSKAKASGEAKDWNDFEAVNNPFLAYAARCTSAFPFAFEPMCLSDIDDVLGKLKGSKDGGAKNPQWQRFFNDYPSPVDARTVPFPQRAFGDGGYLDNKPFTYATETLARRRADVPVDRKLIYIEPSPEHPESEVETDRKPNALENSLAALLTLPRYETIREDLERVINGNRLIERVNRIIQGVERDKDKIELQAKSGENIGAMTSYKDVSNELWAKPDLTDKEWATLDLADMTKRKGLGYVAYHRLEIASITDDLAKLVARVAGFNEDSDYFLITRSLARVWRDSRYIEYREAKDDARPTMNGFLHSFDLSYPIRRLNFMRSRIDRFYRLDKEARELIERRVKGFSSDDPAEQARRDNDFRNELLRIKWELNEIYVAMRRTGRLLRSRHTPEPTVVDEAAAKPISPLYPVVQTLIGEIVKVLQRQSEAKPSTGDKAPQGDGSLILEYFLGPSSSGNRGGAGALDTERIARVCDRRAEQFLGENPDIAALFDKVGESIDQQLRPLMESADEHCTKELLTFPNTSPDVGWGAQVARSIMLHYYAKYDEYDMIIFPILYDTNIGEADEVEIIRISPEDADNLISERDTGCHKLAGTALGNFGAFLEQRWRQNDILWGRLDGAERLIKTLLPCHPQAKQIIGEAQAAIVLETVENMGPGEISDLLIESLMRTKDGEADSEGLFRFFANLRKNATDDQRKELNAKINDRELRDYYRKVFETRSRLEPQQALETAARATTVVGDILADISEQYNVANKYVSWVARIGRVSWALVEVAIPRSIPNIIFRHWLKLLYLFEVTLIAGSTLLLNPTIQRFSLTAFAITLATHLTVQILSDRMQYKNKGMVLVKALALALFVLLVVLGLVAFIAITGIADSWWQKLTAVNQWFKGLPPAGWMSRWSVRLGIISLFSGFLLWAIREDIVALFKKKRT